jgi:hypothetical protein
MGEDQNNEQAWKKDRSNTPESDDGLTFDSDPLTNSPLGKPLPTLEETPVSKMNLLVKKLFFLKHLENNKFLFNNFESCLKNHLRYLFHE